MHNNALLFQKIKVIEKLSKNLLLYLGVADLVVAPVHILLGIRRHDATPSTRFRTTAATSALVMFMRSSPTL